MTLSTEQGQAAEARALGQEPESGEPAPMVTPHLRPNGTWIWFVSLPGVFADGQSAAPEEPGFATADEAVAAARVKYPNAVQNPGTVR